MDQTGRTRLTRQILRVDHAGEHGAIAIYRAQIAGVRKRHPDLLPWLDDTLAHEIRHRDVFRSAMDARAIMPCGALAAWALGGTLLGAIMARFGPFGVMVCTAAVERTVHRHLDQQVRFLDGHEGELAALVRAIQEEENEHLRYAESRHNAKGWFARMLGAGVSAATTILIWLSTQGSSLGLENRLNSLAGGQNPD